MSEQVVHPVPREWAEQRADRRRRPMPRSTAARSRIPTASGARKRSGSTGSSRSPRSRTTSFDEDDFRHPLVRRRHAQPLGQLPRPPPGRARRPDRDHLGARRSRHAGRTLTYRRAARRDLQVRQPAQGRGRRARRPGDDLPADGARGGGRDARLRADRRGAFDRLRRVQPRGARQPDRGLRQRRRRYRRRRPARRQDSPAQGQRRRAPAQCHGKVAG